MFQPFETTPRWRYFCEKCRKSHGVLKGLRVEYGIPGARAGGQAPPKGIIMGIWQPAHRLREAANGGSYPMRYALQFRLSRAAAAAVEAVSGIFRGVRKC